MDFGIVCYNAGYVDTLVNFPKEEIEMELQSFWPFIGILVAICIPCVSCAWMVRKAMADMQVGLADLRGDMKVLNERMGGLGQRMDGLDKRMDGLDNHMDKRMDDMNKRMDGVEGEVRGINEFLRRESVKNSEKDKES